MVIPLLFPHQTNFDDENLAVIAKHPESGQIRISKTAKLIEQAKRITYLVTGESKADILKRNRTTPAENLPYPAAKIQAKNGVTEWYLDKAAAKCYNKLVSRYRRFAEMIDYKVNEPISVKQLIELLNKTTLKARRPLEDEKRVAAMLHHADFISDRLGW